MNDEAFIRAMLESPGDPAPRSAYADWLQERGDPRGDYLRAEMEWAKPWRQGKRPKDSPELVAQAAGLEATWVARVSRPPLGVFCDHVEFHTGEGPPDRGAFKEVEEEAEFRIPAHYRALLLNHAGGDLDPNTVRWPFDGKPPWEKGERVQFTPGFMSLEALAESVLETESGKLLWVAGCENGGPNDGTLFLGLERKRKGRVYVGFGMVAEDMEVVEVAPSLAAFLAMVERAEG